MDQGSSFRPVAENVWVKQYPLNLLGGRQGRVVTVIRLAVSGKLIIHSTGPFSPADVEEISKLGTPGWVVDTMLRHDTFAKEGRAAFPNIPYLAPEGFAGVAGVDSRPLFPPPAGWAPEVQILLIDGMPKVKEYVFLHAPSRTLIVADLVFNFGRASLWATFFRRVVMGVKLHPDSARLYPMQIKDRAAYERSLKRLLAWDFDRIVTGHCEVVERDGKALLLRGLESKGMGRGKV
ncbi:MAG: hypothetical protein WCD79_21065 [Chthoniobacteraceae bacterium]